MRLQLGVDSYRPPCDNLTVHDAHGRPVRTTAFVSVPHIRYIHVCTACSTLLKFIHAVATFPSPRPTPPPAACSSLAPGPQPGLTPSILPFSSYRPMLLTRQPPSHFHTRPLPSSAFFRVRPLICAQVRPLADAAFGAKNYALTAEGHDAHGGRLRLQEGGRRAGRGCCCRCRCGRHVDPGSGCPPH